MNPYTFISYKIIAISFAGLFFMNNSIAQKSSNFSFNFRDTYFPMLSNTPEFKTEYHNMPLDETWGLWGHNLPKWVPFYIQPNSSIYALVNDERNTEQFCFSSEELKEIIIKNIKERKKTYTYYMIAPNDNALVCQCDKCLTAGNTKTDASPAVFHLLQELAEEFPKQKFFTTAYISTKKPPQTRQPENVGIFFSTIDYQEGKPYSTLHEAEELISSLQKWKKKVPEIYVWEYALNYDNYLDFYPNLKILQENLRFLKKNGVTGIFINGSETYSAMQEVKAGSIARLLTEVDSDLNEIISSEIEKRYPAAYNQLICDYYLNIQDDFAESNQPMGIYSGIQETIKKYLDIDRFNHFYEELQKASSENSDFNTQALLLSATFLKLEQMRYLGIKPNGYATLEENTLKIKPEVEVLLEKIELLSKETEILYYNEPKAKISEYINLWKNEIIQLPKINYLLSHPLNVLSKLDSGYSNPKILNDGAYGFLDYNTNWLICTIEDLKIEINAKELNEHSKKLNIGFLNDPKHNIYFPKEISVTYANENKVVAVKPSSEKMKKSVEIPLEFNKINNNFIITIKRANTDKTKTGIACDEIIIN